MTTYRYTLAELRGQLRRFLLSGAAIALGVAFLIASVSGSGALVDSFGQTAAAEVGPGDVQITRPVTRGGVDAATADRVRRVPGVAAIAPRLTGRGGLLTSDGRPLDEGAVISSVAADPGLRWQLLASGRWPAGPGEVVLDAGTAERLGVHPGAEVRLTGADGTPATARLTGTLDGRGAPSLAGHPVIGVPESAVGRYTPGAVAAQLDVRLAPDASRPRTAEALRVALRDGGTGSGETGGGNAGSGGADGTEVRTREASVEAATRGSGAMYGMVLVAALSFVLIALAVARMVVGNTFSVLLAQRTRQLALLRCVGADRGQVRRLIRRQGLLLGAGASVAGVLLGIGVCAAGQAAAAVADLGPVHLSFAPSPLVCALAALFGVLLTLLAVRGPAKAASAVPPIAALGGAGHGAPVGTVARVRATVWSAVLLVAGGALVVLGAFAAPPLSLLAVTVGSIASFFGVLRLAHRLLPAGVALLGAPARRLGGTAGRLATQQLRLNPLRTGATGSALLLGVTVMVGAVTTLEITSNSLVPAVSAHQPGVFSVTSAADGGVPAEALTALTGERTLSVTPVRSASVRVDGRDTLVAAVDPARLKPTTDDLDRARALTDGTALGGLVDGGPTVTVTAPAATTAAPAPAGTTAPPAPAATVLRIEPGRSALPFVLESDAALLVTPATLDRIAPGAPATTVWVDPASGTDRPAARRALDRALAAHPRLTVTDAGARAESLRSMLDRMMLISMALLGFSVVIAGLGVAATLVLSISERAREIGMLRAIGMSRTQLRRMLTLEALLLSLAAALLGTSLGIGYGWAAARSVTATVGTTGGPPVLLVLAALGLTVLTGLAAAVLPARRVGRMTAVAAMRST
ncbi:ABC transporter permease [Kitasatospora sp. NPDC056327]|uniref:ABC transporter permease n=1 Tax=Kitasatospora sp. NPDC056327 TaxID=3345785 RepID=UPI0035D9CFB0